MREHSAPTVQGRVWVQFTNMISVHLEGCVGLVVRRLRPMSLPAAGFVVLFSFVPGPALAP